jgi:hypothetical protein
MQHDEDDDDEHDESDDPKTQDARPLAEIARSSMADLYRRALRYGAVSKFEEDDDAPAHAVCFVSNSLGEHGWVVVTAGGYSWEGLDFEVSEVFPTPEQATRQMHCNIATDEFNFEERMADQEAGFDEEGESDDADSDAVSDADPDDGSDGVSGSGPKGTKR